MAQKRKRKESKRNLTPFMDKLVPKLHNLLMKSGKKKQAFHLYAKGLQLLLEDKSFAPHLPSPPSGFVPRSSGVAQPVNPAFTGFLPRGVEETRFPASLTKTVPLGDETKGQPLTQLFFQRTATHPKPYKVEPRGSTLWQTLVHRVRPYVVVRKLRVASSVLQVPQELSKKKGERLALRWILEFANQKRKKERLSFLQAFQKQLGDETKGHTATQERRDQLHRVASINRTSLRYRWW